MALNERAVELVQKGARDLPPLPHATTALLTATQRERVTATQLEEILATDPALAGKTMRVVNSAYYGMPRQVTTLSQAVIILGVQQMRNLALGLGALSTLEPAHPKAKARHARLWKESFGSACSARAVARELGVIDSECEECFLLGLLHNVGRLFLLAVYPHPFLGIEEDASRDDAVLFKRFGASGHELGQALMEHWKLPEPLCAGVGQVEHWEESDWMARIVRAGDALVLDGDGEYAMRLGLTEEQFAGILQMTEVGHQEASTLLGLAA